MEIYDIAIAPGQVRDIFCQGSYVYFYSGNAGGADATITVNQDSRGQRVLLMPGQAYRMPVGDAGTRWLIGNLKDEGTIVGRLVIGQGELTDNRVTGSVEVIDGDRNLTNAGLMFSGSSGSNPNASLYAVSQLWNPVGSGKNIVVKCCNFSTPNGQAAVLNIGNVQMATDVTATRSANKLSGGANSAAMVRHGHSETIPTTGFLQAYNMTANQIVTWKACGPLVIKPGFGFNLTGAAINTSATLNVEWLEEGM